MERMPKTRLEMVKMKTMMEMEMEIECEGGGMGMPGNNELGPGELG